MLRELSRPDWLAILDLDERHVPAIVVLRGTRNLRRNYEKYRRLFTDPLEMGSPNGLFEDVLIGKIDGHQVGYASVYGPAMASEIAHVFGVLGTRRVIQTGVCGGLADDMRAGDLVVATEAGCGEGAVACYLQDSRSTRATPSLVERAIEITGPSRIHTGRIWTTAALLAEGMDDLQRWRDDGFIAVDMETATTYGVAEWTGMECISVLSVFDNPLAGGHIALDERDKQQLREEGEDRMLAVVLGLIGNAPRVPVRE